MQCISETLSLPYGHTIGHCLSTTTTPLLPRPYHRLPLQHHNRHYTTAKPTSAMQPPPHLYHHCCDNATTTPLPMPTVPILAPLPSSTAVDFSPTMSPWLVNYHRNIAAFTTFIHW
ncbi:hypothetical protein Acr_00g0013630 [Actinidia rufa]|uniref:Uncharacterized protein n=1 Tax=Actinidia rufa TaxID=165716 RepID=A0A7J0DBW8_9ERIC|nr:hypothetical protein Acr_00g0013630 [Actinidia rufa]